MTTWQILEENVKTISSLIWNCSAQNETINGVKIDCVLKPENDRWILIEVTENNTLVKVRNDISKFAVCRQYLFSQNIYAKCYLVLSEEPTESMQTSGAGVNVEVLSYTSFSKLFIDYNSYSYSRNLKIFGSSVDPIDGKPDKIDYTPVLYEDVKSHKDVKLNEIAKCLINKKRIVLLGHYGTGKSRCIKELFNLLIEKSADKILYPIAINLKENWGTQMGEEIIRRHFGSLGMSSMADSAIKILDSDKFVFLLDGFDEIGAQIWSNDTSKLEQIRSSSLKAIKDLIQKTKSPLIITGREHYFNSQSEMFKAIGLKSSDTELLRCKNEFTDDEMKDYLKNLALSIDLPVWLPRRPLICQIINSIEKGEREKIFLDSFSAVEFWNTLIQNICIRESRISPILSPDTIYKILKEISNFTRNKGGNVGPISITEINKAFEIVVGTPPVDESAVMLQRLPSLGRISSETKDRQFIDNYILDGLRADSLIDIVYNDRIDIVNEKWLNPLGKTGIEIVAKKILEDRSANAFIEFLKKTNNGYNNKIIKGDILASLIYSASSNILDLGGIIINDTSISLINFSRSLIENFMITNSFIDELDVSNCSFSKITIKDSLINKIYGISNSTETPSFLIDCCPEEYISDSLDSGNRLFNLKPSHMILISILKKTYFLSNDNKSADELLSCFGKKEDKAICKQILQILTREKILVYDLKTKTYSHKSYNKKRVSDIVEKLEKSDDKLWREIGKIN